jgi:hypothetical protein
MFDVVWHRRRLEWRSNAERAPWIIEAILLERVLLGRKPAMKIVCKIASIHEDHVNETAARDLFWQNAGRKLGKMRRLAPRDVWQIEGEIAKRMPKPQPVLKQS